MTWSVVRKVAPAVAVLVVIAAGTAMGVSLTKLSFTPVEPGSGQVSDSALTIADASLGYSGIDATGATVDVNNTDTVDHTGDVHLSLIDSTGTVVTSATKTDVRFSGNDTVTSVRLSFTATNVTDFASVEVRIEVTG